MNGRYPRWNPGPAETGGARDYCSKAGAERLAAKIVAAWAEVGVSIEAQVVYTSAPTVADRHGIYTVRLPAVINGLHHG